MHAMSRMRFALFQVLGFISMLAFFAGILFFWEALTHAWYFISAGSLFMSFLGMIGVSWAADRLANEML